MQRYAALGVHRYGSPGERAAMDWIEGELRAAGLAVSSQALRMPRQYVLEHAEVRVGDAVLPAFPHWWIPEASASFELDATLSGDGEDARGRLVWLRLAHDRQSYLDDTHRAAIARAVARTKGRDPAHDRQPGRRDLHVQRGPGGPALAGAGGSPRRTRRCSRPRGATRARSRSGCRVATSATCREGT